MDAHALPIFVQAEGAPRNLQGGLMMRSTMSPNGRRVLVADDQPHVRRIVSDKLTKAGYEVFVAEDGDEALRMVAQHHPDAMVVDYRMPGLNGMDLSRALLQDTTTASIPVVLLTAYDAQVLRLPLGETNIRVMITKPFSPADIVRVVNNLFEPNDEAARLPAAC
jgi:CheY-like chemotaxis protein